MNKNKRNRKLFLSRETVRLIEPDNLNLVLGGDPPDDGTGKAQDVIVPYLSMYPPC